MLRGRRAHPPNNPNFKLVNVSLAVVSVPIKSD